MISSQTSNDLFNKIRSKFANIQIGNNLGEVTANPYEAVFFDFEFTEDSDTFGRVSISLADGDTVKVFYNKGLVDKIDEDSRTNWYSFLKELKDFAVTHQLGFDVRDINKTGLSQQDFKNLADTNKAVNTTDMSEELNRIAKLAGISESLTGTSRSSFENLDKTRLIIRHSKPVAEEVPGARTRHINSLYIENSDGERFKYPITHLAGARAMARHVANGGVPHDDFGKHIINTSEQIAQLNSFNRYVATKDQLNASAGDIIERARMKCETLKKYMKGLSKQSHYTSAKESFQPAVMPELDDATKQQLTDQLTLRHFDEKIDSALPLINSIMKETETVQELDGEDKPLSAKDIEIPTAVDGGNEVLKFLASGRPLILKRDPGAEHMAFRSEFKDKKDKLRAILMDIANRMLSANPEDDRVANFASAVANDLAKVGDPFGDTSPNFQKDLSTAYKLAIRYMQDHEKMRKNPEYAKQVRKDPEELKAKVDRQGRAKEEIENQFEGWADNIVEQKPYVSMYRGGNGKMVYDVLDKDGESAFTSDNYHVATNYLTKNFDRLSGKDKTDDHFDTALTQTAMDDVNENPETDQEMSMDFEFTGDDGETAMGTLHYKVINGKVDPNSLRGESEYEGNAKVDDEFATIMVQPGGGDHESAMIAAQDDYDEVARRMWNKFGEGNEFAQAVQKAKAAGMKPGDKFEVGGKEYTLKDAIEQAGLQLETFFGEDESVAEDTGDQALAKALAKYFQDRADSYPKKNHGDQEHEEMTSIADAFRTDGLQAGMDDINTASFEFSSNPFNQDGSGDTDDDMMMLLKKHGVTAKLKGDLAYLTKGGKSITNPVEDPYESVAEAKPDFLDLDKDGNKTEPMKSAAQDAKKESTEVRQTLVNQIKEYSEIKELADIKKLAGI